MPPDPISAQGHGHHCNNPFLNRGLNAQLATMFIPANLNLGSAMEFYWRNLVLGKPWVFHVLSRFLLFQSCSFCLAPFFLHNISRSGHERRSDYDPNGCIRHLDLRRVQRSQPPSCSKSKPTRSATSRKG